MGGFMTPKAQEQTGKIKISMFANFEKSSYELDNLIWQYDEGQIPSDYFVPGHVKAISFAGKLRFIQTKAPHTITFTTSNKMPG
jgi:hypothetical protein